MGDKRKKNELERVLDPLMTLSFSSQFIYSLYLKILVPLGAVIYFSFKGDQQ